MAGLSARRHRPFGAGGPDLGHGLCGGQGRNGAFPPILLMALRFSITALALVWFLGPLGRTMGRLVLISVAGASVLRALTFTGVKGLGAGLSALVVQLEVLPFLVLLGALLLCERPTADKWLGIAISSAGVGLIAAQERFTGSLFASRPRHGRGLPLGIRSGSPVRGLADMTGYITSLPGPPFRPRHNCSCCLLCSKPGRSRPSAPAGTAAWGAALYLGLIATTLGYFLWNSLILRNEVGLVAPLLLLLPVGSADRRRPVLLGETLTLSLGRGRRCADRCGADHPVSTAGRPRLRAGRNPATWRNDEQKP